MQTYAYIWNLGADEDSRAMRGRQGPARDMLAKSVQGETARYQARNGASVREAREWFAEGMARHWAWNVSREWGIDADGPFVAVSFK